MAPVSGKGGDFASGSHIPELQLPLIAAGGQDLAIGGKSEPYCAALVSLERYQRPPPSHSPELHQPIAGAGGQGPPVGGKGDRQDAGLMPGEGGQLAPRGGIPESEGAQSTDGG